MQTNVMLGLILISCLHLSFIHAQITTSARLQPWPISIQQIGLCCEPWQQAMALKKDDEQVAGDEINEPPAHSASLLKCANASANAMPSTSAKVGVLTFVSAEEDTKKHFAVPDIINYAAYHAALTAAYAEQNDYIYKFITPDMPGNSLDELEPADVRWNKVKLLLNALDPETGWARDMGFVVWIDADAVVLDMGMKLEKVAEEQYPNADFIASADIRQGYINSGFLLLRNTAWTREFLQRWWHVADRKVICDQDAFDMIYTEYTKEEKGNAHISAKAGIQSKVAVLRRDALNTDPPATLRQQAHNQVLHLMGQSSAYRTEVFRMAFHNLCQARSGGILPAQLGLHRAYLDQLALRMYKHDTDTMLREAKERLTEFSKYQIPDDEEEVKEEQEEILFAGKDAESTNIVSAKSSRGAHKGVSLKTLQVTDIDLFDDFQEMRRSPDMFEAIGRSAHHLSDLLLQRENMQSEVYHIRTQVLQSVFEWLQEGYGLLSFMKYRIARLTEEKEDTYLIEQLVEDKTNLVLILLQLLKRAAESGNDVFGAAPSEAQKRDAAEKTFHVLQELHSRVDVSSQAVPGHMMALMHQNMAYMEYGIATGIPAAGDPDALESDMLDLEKEQESEEHRSTHTRSAAANTRRKASLLKSARIHAESSVQLFDKYLSDTTERSVTSENVHSLQILAAVHCTENLNLTRGLIVWERTVHMASAAMRGVHMGPPLDMYGGILHNAAVCYQQAGSTVALDRASLLAKEAVNARELYSTQQGISTQEDDNDKNAPLKASRDLLRNIDTKRKHTHSSGIDIGIGSVSGSSESSGSDAKVYQESDFTEEEWEECQEGEEGCEAFYVTDEGAAAAAAADVDPAAANTADTNTADADAAAQSVEASLSTPPKSSLPSHQPRTRVRPSLSPEGLEEGLNRVMAVDLEAGFDKLQEVSKTSHGLEATLDELNAFMLQLSSGKPSEAAEMATPAAATPPPPAENESDKRASAVQKAPAAKKDFSSAGSVPVVQSPAEFAEDEWQEIDVSDEEEEDEIAEARLLWRQQTAAFGEL